MDVDSPASRTALGAARHRALHQLLEAGAVFSDPLAVPILGLPETELRARDADRRMRLFIAARQRYRWSRHEPVLGRPPPPEPHGGFSAGDDGRAQPVAVDRCGQAARS